MAMLSNLELLLVVAFFTGYSLIALEYYFKINKTAVALVLCAVTWGLLFFQTDSIPALTQQFYHHFGEAAELVIFLLGAMTLVEVIDAHNGFHIVARAMHSKSSFVTTCTITTLTFFLSATLDNTASTAVMISLIRKIVYDTNSRLYLGSLIVIAANAGGAWTPIGDVTTIMLWVSNRITSLSIMKALFVPSVVCALVALLLIKYCKTIRYRKFLDSGHKEAYGAKLVLTAGVASLVCVPIFKHVFKWPPFMGVLLGLGILWVITDILHHREESRYHLRVPHVLTKVDTSVSLFFLGILLSVHSLQVGGVLERSAYAFQNYKDNLPLIAVVVGIVSSVIDNVPVVATIIGMFDISTYPLNHTFWEMIAYCAGTGGSILVIGSAAGIIFMGTEKVTFGWYLKHISLIALISFFAGMASYLLIAKYAFLPL